MAKLDGAICSDIATDVLAARMALGNFFNTKHVGCMVRAKTLALRNERTKTVRCARVVEAQHGNKTTIQSLTKRNGYELSDFR